MARILFIDDSNAFLDSTGEVLHVLGHEVTKAHDGNEGIARYREEQFDLVITDLLMPGISGQDVIAAIRAIDPKARIIVSEGSSSAHPIGAFGIAEHLGVNAHLQKPYSIARLATEITRVLGASGDR